MSADTKQHAYQYYHTKKTSFLGWKGKKQSIHTCDNITKKKHKLNIKGVLDFTLFYFIFINIVMNEYRL